MSEGLKAGWYADPAREADQRWWDGSRWTPTTRTVMPPPAPEPSSSPAIPVDDVPAEFDPNLTQRIDPVASPNPGEVTAPMASFGAPTTPPHNSAADGWAAPPAGAQPVTPSLPSSETEGAPPPGRGRRPAVVVGSLLAVFLLSGGVTAAVLTWTDRDAGEATSDAAAPVHDESGTTADLEGPAGSDGPDGDDGSDGSDAPLAEVESPSADEVRSVELDGGCTVDAPTDVPAEQLRAWEFEACSFAPVDLGQGNTWIVVVTSLNGDDFTSDDALERAEELGLSGQVLWSSHYASLNPGLWVVFDGPFADEAAAADVAGRSDGTIYPRLLSDDDSDRYCMAGDGCVGERAD